MKIFMGSLTDFSQEVDAYVPNKDQGIILLRALAREFAGDAVIMRARMQRYENYEEKFIGEADLHSPDFEHFLDRVVDMGEAESNLIKGAMK